MVKMCITSVIALKVYCSFKESSPRVYIKYHIKCHMFFFYIIFNWFWQVSMPQCRCSFKSFYTYSINSHNKFENSQFILPLNCVDVAFFLLSRTKRGCSSSFFMFCKWISFHQNIDDKQRETNYILSISVAPCHLLKCPLIARYVSAAMAVLYNAVGLVYLQRLERVGVSVAVQDDVVGHAEALPDAQVVEERGLTKSICHLHHGYVCGNRSDMLWVSWVTVSPSMLANAHIAPHNRGGKQWKRLSLIIETQSRCYT